MTNVDESIVNKIKNLLNKTVDNGCTIEESAAAFAVAQRLIETNRLSMQDIDSFGSEPEEEIMDYGSVPGTESQRTTTWKNSLAGAIAKYNGCKVYISTGNSRMKIPSSIKVIGRYSDVQIVNYLYMFISREIERLCKVAMVEESGFGKSWSNTFKIGATHAIIAKLKSAKEEARVGADETAIVRVNQNDQAVIDWTNNKFSGKNKLAKRPPAYYRKVGNAYESGVEAGNNIQTNVALSGGKPVKQLGS